MKYLFSIPFLLLLAINSYAAVVITDVSSGVITGTGFGSNSLDIEYLGSNIEDGTDGGVFVKTGWTQDSTVETNSQAVVRYSTNYAHSGDQSLIVDYANDGGDVSRYRGYAVFDHGSAIAPVYVSMWLKSNDPGECVAGGAGCQWKIWRLNDNGEDEQANAYTDYYLNEWTGGQSSNSTYVNPSGDEWMQDAYATQYWNASDEGPSLGGDQPWTRIEYYFEESTIDTEDGTIQYWYHHPSDSSSITNPVNLVDLAKTRKQNYNYRYVVVGHVSGVPNLEVYFDDVFIQSGSPARVEIGNASTWAACTHREIQLPIVWGTTEVTYTEQLGSLPAGAAYLYVVDDNGDVNTNGYEITIGSTGALQAGTGEIQDGSGAFE